MALNSMGTGDLKVIIVVYRRDADELKALIADTCRLGWESAVKLLMTTPDDDKNYLTDEVIYAATTYGKHCKVFFQGSSLDKRTLNRRGIEIDHAASIKTLFTKIKSTLRDTLLDWKEHARSEWEKSSIGHISTDVWYQQLAENGQRDLAKKLLKALKVITQADLRKSFKRDGASDDVGQSCLHAYIKDGEPGSSSITIQNVLDHMFPIGTVHPLDLADERFFDEVNVDVLYIYEDGLWSGVELVKRLCYLAGRESFMKSKTRIEFKYSVLSDAGLSAGRIAASNYPSGKFVINPGGERFNFFREGVDSQFSHLTDRTDANVRKAVDESIEPYVFSIPSLWGASRETAMETCADIGAQLIKPYLERQAREKARQQAAKEGMTESDLGSQVIEIDESKIARWQLGAERFGSTIVFESSVPKPVLPLMWLHGPVTIGDRQLEWQPLFWDARRIGTAAP